MRKINSATVFFATALAVVGCGGGSGGGGNNDSPASEPTTNNSAPTANQVWIDTAGKNLVRPRDTLTGNYQFFDADGDTEGQSQYQWLREGVAIPGANSTSYVLGDEDNDKSIEFQVTPVAVAGTSLGTSQRSPALVVNNSAPIVKNVGIAVEGGASSAYVSSVLQVNFEYQDAEKDEQGTVQIRWLREGNVIEGANQALYKATKEDAGRKLKVEVTPVATRGTLRGSPVVSAAIEVKNSAPTVTDVIITASTKPAVAGSVLTCHYTYADIDGDPEGTSTFRWARISTNGTSTVIPGATLVTYTMTAADTDPMMTCEVTPVAAHGITSGLAVISAPFYVNNSPPEAKDVTIVANSDPAVVGTKLNAIYTYSDDDGDLQSWALFTWFVDGVQKTTNSTGLYVVAPEDLTAKMSATFSVTVKPVARSGTTQGLPVASANTITAYNSAPSISNVHIYVNYNTLPVMDSTIYGSYNFLDIDNDKNSSTYHWYVSDTADGPTTLLDTTTSAYTIKRENIGKWLTFEVTLAVSTGKTVTGVVQKSAPVQVVNTAPVVIELAIKRKAGTNDSLTADYVYTDLEGDAEGATAFQWKRDGVAIVGATNRAYVMQALDVGHKLTVAVTPVATEGVLNGLTVQSASLVVAGDAKLTIVGGIKQLLFSWQAVTGAVKYRLSENPDGVSGFTPLVETADRQFTYDISVHRTNWPNVQFLLESCDSTGLCRTVTQIGAVAAMADAIGYFKASNSDMDDQFGSAIALSGDGSTLVVGAPYERSKETGVGLFPPRQATDNNQGGNGGAVYVFTRKAPGEWAQQAYLKASIPNVAPGYGLSGAFGTAVAISVDGNTLAVGAPYESNNVIGINKTPNANEIGAAPWSGAVFIFTRDADTWVQQSYIKPGNTKPYDIFDGSKFLFGSTVALSADGNTLAVGAPHESVNSVGINSTPDPKIVSASWSGAVYIFTREASIWSQQAHVKASNADSSDEFGGALALSADGNTLVIGAVGDDNNAVEVLTPGPQKAEDNYLSPDSGAAYVFVREAGVWRQQSYLKASNSVQYIRFGSSVAISADGNTLMVSAPSESSGTKGVSAAPPQPGGGIPAIGQSGAVYAFGRDAQGVWTQQYFIKDLNSTSSLYFGRYTSISADGNSFAVGLPTFRGDVGQVHNFVRDATLGWVQSNTLSEAGGLLGQSSRLGNAMAFSIDGKTLAVGACYDSSNAVGVNGDRNKSTNTKSGAVFLY